MAQIQFDDGERDWMNNDQIGGDYSTYGGTTTSQPPTNYPTYQPPTSEPTKFYTPPTGGVSGYANPSAWADLLKGIQTQPQQAVPEFTGDYRAYFQALTGGGAADRGVLDRIEPMLSKVGINVQRASDNTARGRIHLPTGEGIDVVQGRGWGDPWAWNPAGTNTGGGLEGGGGTYGADPTLTDAIRRLSAPTYGTDPVLTDAIAKLTALFSQQNAGLERFTGLAENRLKQLQDPAMTDAQRAQARTSLQEPIESQRASAQQRVLERASARGQGIDQGFERLLGEGFRALSLDEMNRNERRGQEAVSIGQIMAALGAAQQGQQANIASQLAGLGQFNANQQASATSQLANIGQYLTGLPIAQLGAATNSMSALNNQVIPQQDNISGLIGLMLGLAGQGQNAYDTTMGQEGGFWGSLFGQLPGIIGGVMGGSGGGDMTAAGDIWNDDPFGLNDNFGADIS
jgi:hypothetical protein